MADLAGRIGRLCLAAVLALMPVVAGADPLSALARLVPAQSQISGSDQALDLQLALTQPVPWRLRLLDDPPRLVLDFREVDWQGIDSVPQTGLAGLRSGALMPGWSRLVAVLPGPMLVRRAGMETAGGGARVVLRLEAAGADAFAARVAEVAPPAEDIAPGWDLPPATLPAPASDRFVVVLDPGHGGIDPGATGGGQVEAALVLQFARELKEVLLRQGGDIAVVLTREEDVFVPLEARISAARALGADVFLSLHADALSDGAATGATIYTLAASASDAASRALAERHDQDDLLSGVDLTGQDDVVARVLMDMARTETAPKVSRLAQSLIGAINGAGLQMHSHPHQEAAFSVLKSPDVPSALVELGFMSSPEDLARLRDPAWRAQMAGALSAGLRSWAEAEAALSGLE